MAAHLLESEAYSGSPCGSSSDGEGSRLRGGLEAGLSKVGSRHRRALAASAGLLVAAAACVCYVGRRAWAGHARSAGHDLRLALGLDAVLVGSNSTSSGTPIRLCTDGWAFAFSAHVTLGAAPGPFDVLTSSAGSLNLTASADVGGPLQLTLGVSTYNYGVVRVTSAELQSGVAYNVVVTKGTSELCLQVCPTDVGCGGEAPKCTYPGGVPEVGFQMAAPGDLLLGAGAGQFAQSQGFVPVSFVLSGVPFDGLYKDTDGWDRITANMREMLATVAGNDVTPDHVQVAPISAGPVTDSTLFSGSVMPTHTAAGAACKVQDAIASGLGKDAGRSYFAAATVALAGDAALGAAATSGGLALAGAQVPAAPLLCAAVACPRSFRLPLPPGAQCRGAGCHGACCQESWSETTLPLEDGLGSQPAVPEPRRKQAAPSAGLLPEFRRVDFAAVKPTAGKDEGAEGETVEDGAVVGKKTLQDWADWAKKQSGEAPASAKVLPLATDGLGFEVKLQVAVTAFAGEQQVVGADLDAVKLVLTGQPENGSAIFSTPPLNNCGGSQLEALGTSCEVELSGLEAPATYEFTLVRDSDRCCLEAVPVTAEVEGRRLHSGEKRRCVARAAEAPKACWQMRPVHSLALYKTPGAEAIEGTQQAGAVTASFTLANVQYDGLQDNTKFLEGVREAVAFAAKVPPEQIAISLTSSWYAEGALPADLPPARSADGLPAIPAPVDKALQREHHRRQAKIHELETAAVQHKADAAAAAVEAAAPTSPTSSETTTSAEGAATAVVKRRLVEAPAGVQPAVSVQVTISGCGSCTAESTRLTANGFLAEAAQSHVAAALGDDSKANVVGVTVPAETASCAEVVCPAYLVPDPTKICYGGHCQETCCKPSFCHQHTCAAPMVRNIMSAFKQCSNETDCQNKCCLTPCKDYVCQGASCPRAQNWMRFAKPLEVEQTCCAPSTCCGAPIAWCIKCLKCQSMEAYCASKMAAFLSPPSPAKAATATAEPRRLRSQGGGAREAPSRKYSTLSAVGAQLRRLQEKRELAEVITVEWQKAVQFHMADQASSNMSLQDLGVREDQEWKTRWAQVNMDSTTAHYASVAGCLPVLGRQCRYHFSTMFLLHRGFGKDPSPVNTVAIMTDTLHAVTCGADTRCWVWYIADGSPKQVFLSHTGPVNSVSVLWDGTYVVSAGESSNGAGEAFIWWWQMGNGGTQPRSMGCSQPFLSTAPMPAWRQALLGCADNYTYWWNWAGGVSYNLPWFARTSDYIKTTLKAQHDTKVQETQDGITRVALSAVKDKLQTFAGKVFPNRTGQGWGSIFNNITANRMGAVNAVAYVPTNLRFATGHSDGVVRYWSADSGALLNVMRGHQGPVTSLAASSKKQQVLSGGEDGTVRLWDLQTGQQLLLLYQPFGGPVRSVGLIPGDCYAAVGSEDGFVRIWNVNTGLLECQLQTFGGPVLGMAINPSNPMGQIITANADGYARVFNPDVYGQV